uniref:Parvalbumin n=1 Tax=Oncorhynchus tshawytscha TaxID=74940 RepID=A0AAZ3SET5_ONCTS
AIRKWPGCENLIHGQVTQASQIFCVSSPYININRQSSVTTKPDIFWFGHRRGQDHQSAPDSFSFKKFSQLCGLTSKSPKEVKDVFQILDEDNSGFIEESELKFFLQRFVPGARTLTDAECKGFLSAADDDNDGKIGVEEFLIMVQS